MTSEKRSRQKKMNVRSEEEKRGRRERWEDGSRLWRTASPGMKSMVGSGAVVPPARDRWDSQSGIKGQMVWPHPHRCQHILNSPQFTRNQYQALQFRRYYEFKEKCQGCICVWIWMFFRGNVYLGTMILNMHDFKRERGRLMLRGIKKIKE